MTKSMFDPAFFDGWEIPIIYPRIHKIDGPVFKVGGIDFYYLDGTSMTFKDWKQKVRKYYETDEDYLLMLLKL